MLKKLLTILVSVLLLTMVACNTPSPNPDGPDGPPNPTPPGVTYSTNINYTFATKAEAEVLIASNTDYHDRMSQQDLNYRLQKEGATKEDYVELAKAQVGEFTEDEKTIVTKAFDRIKATLVSKNAKLPELEKIYIVKTNAQEEMGAGGYTLANQIYLNGAMISAMANYQDQQNTMDTVLAHELFHCLTRAFPEFKKEIYNVIGFKPSTENFEIDPAFKDMLINNPDVDPASYYAQFTLNGVKQDAYLIYVAKSPFAASNPSVFSNSKTLVVPVNQPNLGYEIEMVPDFYDVMGKNTNYVIDPEECLADNFSYAINFGTSKPGGGKFDTPKIIEDIIAILQGFEK